MAGRVSLNRKLAADWHWEDCPWWYNERTSVGTLAAAVWKEGGYALEEYTHDKGKGAKKFKGRCDLYMEVPGHEIAAEAKLVWAVRSASKALVLACRDAAKVKSDETKIGVVFVTPRAPEESPVTLRARIKEWSAALDSIPADASAYVFFPNRGKLLLDEEQFLCPGLAVLLKLA